MTEIQAVKAEVRAAFHELHGVTQAAYLREHGTVAAGAAWQRAEALARRRVGLNAWKRYRDHMARQRARQHRREANGNGDGSVSEGLALEPGLQLSHRAEGRGARRRARSA